jgi:hypothetical protein
MKTKIVSIAFILLAGFLNFASAKNNPSTVSGTVYETVNGLEQPVALAYVFIDNTVNCTYTNLDGSFDLNLPEGKHTLKVVFKGYETKTQKISVKKGKAVRILLKPENEAVAEK